MKSEVALTCKALLVIVVALVGSIVIRVDFTKEHLSHSTIYTVVSGPSNLGTAEQGLKAEAEEGGKMLLLRQQRVARTTSRLKISAKADSSKIGDQSKPWSLSSEQKCSQAKMKSERLNL